MLLKAGAEERHMDDKQYFNGMLNAQNAERFGLSFLFEKYYSAEQKIDKFIFITNKTYFSLFLVIHNNYYI